MKSLNLAILSLMMVLMASFTDASENKWYDPITMNEVPAPILEKPKEIIEETFVEKQKRIYELYEQIDEQGKPDQTKPLIGKATEWVINNLNKKVGWSLTGPAVLRINKNGEINRWKFGIINGEVDGTFYNQIEKDHRYELLDRWNREKNNYIIIGLFFSKDF